MEYETFKIGKYNVHFVITNKFNTITLKAIYRRPIVKEEIAVRNLLIPIMLEATSKYPSRRLLEIESENLYNLTYNINSQLLGIYNNLEFSVKFLNEKYTEKGMNEKSIEFFADLIFKPYAINNAFDEQKFNQAKNIFLEDLETYNDSSERYSNTRLCEEMFNGTVLAYRGIGYKEDLDGVTSESAYKLYQDIIKNDLADIFVIGAFDKKEMQKLLSKYFQNNEVRKEEVSPYATHEVFKKEFTKIVEAKDYLQSILLLGYKLDNLTDFERQYVSYIFSYILGGSGDSKLFKNVREKNSLCYYVFSRVRAITNSMTINAGINAKDSEKAIQLINECLNDMIAGGFDDEQITNAITTYTSALLEIEDSPNEILNTYISQALLGTDSTIVRAKKIREVTKEMVINFAKKIHPDTIFLLEGNGENEKNTNI